MWNINQLDVCQSAEMYSVQKAKAEKEKHWQQRSHQTTGGKNQTEYLHPIHLLWSSCQKTKSGDKNLFGWLQDICKHELVVLT